MHCRRDHAGGQGLRRDARVPAALGVPVRPHHEAGRGGIAGRDADGRRRCADPAPLAAISDALQITKLTDAVEQALGAQSR